MTKFCPECKCDKSSVEFSKNRRNSDGLQSYCKPCHRAQSRRYFEANREHVKETVRVYGRANRDKVVARVKVWRINNRDQYRLQARVQVSKRRARLANNGGQHSVKEWKELVQSTGSCCLDCKQPGTAKTLTRDHIVPISRGGSDNITNIQPLCQRCNNKKFVDCTNFMVRG